MALEEKSIKVAKCKWSAYDPMQKEEEEEEAVHNGFIAS